MLVIDEADLILGFGYGPDMEQLVSAIPQTVHSLLMSASLTPEVDQLKQLLLRNAVTLKLEDPVDEQENLKQFTIELSSQEDKFLLTYVILKLGLLKGKLLIFVNEVDRAYRLKLFLEQFGIRSCVVNAELPLASRHHIVEEFNKGVYDLLIASDQAVQLSQHTSAAPEKMQKKRSKKTMEGESMARGIDFKRVDVVLNFDFPSRVDSYIHRVGRTARAGLQGTAISFVCPSEDGPVLDLVRADVQERTGKELAPYAFDMKQIEGFRYRCQDAMRSVTGANVKEARLKDLKRELVASERLKTFFAERPKDLELLKHDKGLLAANKAKPHLKHVPEYLVKSRPAALSDSTGETADTPLKLLPQTEPTPSNRQLKARTQRKPKAKDPLKRIKRR
jgi:ATP-dependent RNA helicase DDX56/DBP9